MSWDADLRIPKKIHRKLGLYDIYVFSMWVKASVKPTHANLHTDTHISSQIHKIVSQIEIYGVMVSGQ